MLRYSPIRTRSVLLGSFPQFFGVFFPQKAVTMFGLEPADVDGVFGEQSERRLAPLGTAAVGSVNQKGGGGLCGV